MNSFILGILLLSLTLRSSAAFAPVGRLFSTNVANDISLQLRPGPATAGCSRASSTMLMVKKRRRRKTPPTTTQTSDDNDELPDFDDGEDDDMEETTPAVAVEVSKPAMQFDSSSSAKATPIKKGSGLNKQLAEEVGGNVDGLDEETILEAMRGKAGGDKWEPPRSIQDTLSDRRLEKFMDFDRVCEYKLICNVTHGVLNLYVLFTNKLIFSILPNKMIAQDGGGGGSAVDLPDFEEVISRRKQREAMQEGRVEDAAMLIDTEGMGKKAARNAQRKAEAMQRSKEMEEEESNPFASLEGLNILQLLEKGAWTGIGLLVAWEVYINSPFFERAAPLIPVVYDNPTPPGM